MGLFHRHVWKNHGDYEYHLGVVVWTEWWFQLMSFDDPSSYDGQRWMEKLMNGWTTFHERCSACGKITTREVLGRYDPTKEA